MIRCRRPLLLFAIALAFPGCERSGASAGEGPWPADTEEVSQPSMHPGPDVIELTVIDTVLGSPEAGSIAHFDVHPDGSVAFLDGMSSKVTVVPSEGHAFEVGGAGEGPGEISRGGGVVFLSDRSIVVLDGGLRRLTAWDADGSLRATIGLGMPTSGLRASGEELLVIIAVR